MDEILIYLNHLSHMFLSLRLNHEQVRSGIKFTHGNMVLNAISLKILYCPAHHVHHRKINGTAG